MLAGAKVWLLLPLVAVLAATWGLVLHGDLTAATGWAALGAHEASLHGWVATAPILAAGIYCAVYVACVAASLPFGVFLSVCGGLLFGTAVGAALALLSATGGAVLLFLLARGALAPLVARRAAPLMDRLGPRLRREGFWYLLALRLMPVVPFWLTNLAAGLAGMRLAPFALATLIGAAPMTTLLASIGAGVAGVLANGAPGIHGSGPDLSMLRAPSVLLPLAGLIVLSLLPVAWRHWRRPAPESAI
jgi:uncharacterized membrane protein YdjX (TVP38/TMEM64 family)